VTLALCVFAVTLVIAVRDGFPERSVEVQAFVIAVMGAAGVAIAGLQLAGATEVAAGVAVFMAITRGAVPAFPARALARAGRRCRSPTGQAASSATVSRLPRGHP
jgi:hypothetical protein